MATSIGKEDDLITMLNNLVALDFDAADAYKAAIGRMISVADQNELRRFLTDHERHIQDLSMIVRDMGGTPPTHTDMHGVLTKGRVVLAEIIGDPAVLGAMDDNEEEVHTAYQQALTRDDLSPAVTEILQRHLGDERRHREWLQQRMEEMLS